MEQQTAETENEENSQVTSLQPGVPIRPTLSCKYACQILMRLYGLKVTNIKEFNSYDDRNFHVVVKEDFTNPFIDKINPHGYMLKILNNMDSKKHHYEGEHLAMKLLYESGIGVPVPVLNVHGNEASLEKIYVEENKNDIGEETTDGSIYTENIVRLLNFIPGRIIWTVPYKANLLFEVGKTIGRIRKVLQGFHHPQLCQFKSVWNMACFHKVKDFTFAVKNEEDQQIAFGVLEAFHQHVFPKIGTLPSGVIHGDVNEQNILVTADPDRLDTYHVAGLLDFGDMSENCYVFDLAMGIMYMSVESKVVPFLEVGGHVLAGYQSEVTLTPEEYDILWLCVAARYVTSLVMGAYSYSMDPGNEYLLVTANNGWPQIRKLWSLSKEDIYATWRKVMEKY